MSAAMKWVHIETDGETKPAAREATTAFTACATTDERSPEWLVERLPAAPTHKSCSARSERVYDSATCLSSHQRPILSNATGVAVCRKSVDELARRSATAVAGK